MDPFDKDCPRCLALNKNQRPVLPTADISSSSGHVEGVPITPDLMPPVAPASPVVLPPQQSVHVNPPLHLSCCVCGNENIQKVSAVHRAGIWASSSSGNTVGVGYVAGAGPGIGVAPSSSIASGHSLLASTLSPPPRPTVEHSNMISGGAIFGTIAFFSLLYGYYLASDPVSFARDPSDAHWAMGIGVCSLIIATLFFYQHYQGEMKARLRNVTKYNRWQDAITNWDQLFYCSRCDQVFNPQTMQAAPAAMMDNLL